MVEKYDESTGAILFKDTNKDRIVENKLNQLIEITSNLLNVMMDIKDELKKLNDK